MIVVRRIARPMMASMFLVGGLDQLRNPAGNKGVAEPTASQVASAVNQAQSSVNLPEDTEQLVRINGAVQVGGGALLVLNRFPRIASLALAGTLVPTTYAAHAFWAAPKDQRQDQMVHFFKNVSMLGGLIIAAVDTEGRESLPRATKRAAKATRRETKRAAKEAKMTAKAGKAAARGKVRETQLAGGKAVEKARRTAKV